MNQLSLRYNRDCYISKNVIVNSCVFECIKFEDIDIIYIDCNNFTKLMYGIDNEDGIFCTEYRTISIDGVDEV
jgi:hypothetical protein